MQYIYIGSDSVQFYKNKIFVSVVAVGVITASLGIISRTGDNFLTNALNVISTPVQSVLASVLRPVKEHFTLINEMKGYKAENERLIGEITRLKMENRDVQAYIEENNRLKSLLDLQEKESDMQTVAAQIVSRDYDKWYKGVTLNKGRMSGIEEGDAVITKEGILGVVKSVGPNWAKVATIFDAESAVGAKFTRTGDVGVVEGDADLSEEGKCKIEYISSAASIINGDIVVTSGIGGIYPGGLMIGKVSEVKTDAMGAVEYAVVEPAAGIDDVYEVLVITDFTEKADTSGNGGQNGQ